jgi:hypothetical protein
MITGQAAFVGIIDQFEVMMIAMLIVSPLVLSPQAVPGQLTLVEPLAGVS